VCRAIYNSNSGDYNYIDTFYNMPPQAEGRGSTRSLKRKAVNEAIESDLIKTSTS
jgi:hypothetical protein